MSSHACTEAKEISVSEVIAQIPFAPFSVFLNDLSRPLFLDNIQPAPEAILSGNSKLLQCINQDSVSIESVRQLLQMTQFDQSSFLLNEPPVKEIAHDFDEFMIGVLDECFEKDTCVYQATTQQPTPAPTQMTIPEPLAHSAPAASKIKLFVGSGTGDAMVAFNRLVESESFVSPLCFDCRDDLSLMGRVLRSFTTSSSLNLKDLPLLTSSLICDTFAQYIRDYLECLQEQRIEPDSAKAMYCMCLITFCNVFRQAVVSEQLQPQNLPYFPFDDFMMIACVAQQPSTSEEFNEDRSEFELICAAAIDSYTRLPAHEMEASAQVNHLLELFFAAESSIQLRRACVSGLSTAFPNFNGAFSVFILEQSMNRCLQTSNAHLNKATAALLLSVLQSSPNVSSNLNFVLNYLWKSDGTELPKGAGLFAVLFEEALHCAFNPKWPVASTVSNHCCLQMFHALLRTEDSSKGAILLKLRFLDQLTTAATALSNNQTVASRGLMAAIEGVLAVDSSFNSTSPEALKRIPERVAGLLIKLISGDAAQLRSKAIKNLYVLMNSTVLNSSNGLALKQSILNRLSDPSISVRDAVLEFVSKLLLDSKGPVSDDALSSVLSRIKDRGLSVRKRACKIVGELLAKGEASLTPAQRIDCLAAFLAHWPEEEDESLQDAQFKCLQTQWLIPCKNAANCRAFAEELSGLLKSPLSVISPLQDFISQVVAAEAKAAASADVGLNTFLAETVNALLESLLRGLESSSSNEVVKGALDTITVLACQPGYLLDHLVLLHTLLRSEDAEVSVSALRLLHIVMPAASFAQLKKLETDDLERDLLGFIYRGSEGAVKLAIECLYLFVNNCSHQYGTLSSLWTRFSEFLKGKQVELESDNPEALNCTSTNTPANMARALIALGILGAQSALHQERELGVQEAHSTPQIRSLLQIIQFYCGVPWSFVRTCALSALCSLLLVCPQLAACWSPFGELVGFFMNSTSADDSGRSKILGLLSSILNASSPGWGHDERSILKMEGKESFNSALIQSLVPQLCQLSCSVDCSFVIRAQALKLASSAAVLGFVNPHQVLPFVCVGMASEDAHLQAFSQASFDKLLGRFPSLAPRDLLQISKLIWNTRPQAHGFSNGPCPLTGQLQSQSLLSALYSRLRASSSASQKKSLKHDLLSGLFGFFERLMSCSVEGSEESRDPQYIAFLVELIVTLPFQSTDEVSLLLMKIQSLFPLAEDVLSRDDLIDGVFVALQGFSASLSFLLRSFPGINATSLQDDTGTTATAAPVSGRSLIRVAQLFNWKHPQLSSSSSTAALEQLIITQTPISELMIKVASATQKQKKRAMQLVVEEEEAAHEEIELEEDTEIDEDEDGGASSEEFEAMLMSFNSEKKGVVSELKKKQKQKQTQKKHEKAVKNVKTVNKKVDIKTSQKKSKN